MRHQHSVDRHRRSARWFARNRKGGRGIRYHRHVGSVFARDWVRQVDLFIGTVTAGGEAPTFPDTPTVAGDVTEPAIADYRRPTAVKSDYLDTAISPPLLGHECKIFTTSGR